jgi:hypothetical protein
MGFLKRIEIADVFQLFGLALIGVGLFLWVGLGVSLTVVGGMLFTVGYFAGFVKGKS